MAVHNVAHTYRRETAVRIARNVHVGLEPMLVMAASYFIYSLYIIGFSIYSRIEYSNACDSTYNIC